MVQITKLHQNRQLEYTEIDPILNAFLQELVQEKIIEQEQRIKDLEEELLQVTDKNKRMELESVIDRLTLANNAMKEGDYIGAENYYRLILSTDEDNLDALEGLGLSLGRQDKFNESIFYYDKLLDIDQDNYEALINNVSDTTFTSLSSDTKHNHVLLSHLEHVRYFVVRELVITKTRSCAPKILA